MQDLQQKLQDQGLVGTLTIRETGQKIPLRFARGERSKLCKLELGPTSTDVELRLVDVPGASPGQPNLTLSVTKMGFESPAPEEKAADEKAADEKAADEKAADEKAADEKAADEKAAAARIETPVNPAPPPTPTTNAPTVAPANSASAVSGKTGGNKGR